MVKELEDLFKKKIELNNQLVNKIADTEWIDITQPKLPVKIEDIFILTLLFKMI